MARATQALHLRAVPSSLLLRSRGFVAWNRLIFSELKGCGVRYGRVVRVERCLQADDIDNNQQQCIMVAT
jgi:hypothetical protein